MIAVLANNQKYNCKKLAEEILLLLRARNLDSVLIKNHPYSKEDKNVLRGSSLLITLGGDGTILSALDEYARPENKIQKAIIAVNMGTLSYMATIPEKVALPLLENFFDTQEELFRFYNFHDDGKGYSREPFLKAGRKKSKFRLQVDKRSLLRIQTAGGKQYNALNEICLLRQTPTKPLAFKIRIGGESIMRFSGDGVLVSTATGSTAYNLSAGGPILSPNIDAYVLTPISPHSLTVKPIVLPREDKLELTCLGDSQFIIDGILKNKIKAEEPLKVELAEHSVFFIEPYEVNPYKILKQKLLWGK